jgi:hypothetical protein
LAKHRVNTGRKPDLTKKAVKKSATPKETTEERLLERLKVIPKSGTLIDCFDMQGMTVAEIRERYGLDDDDEGWRLLLVYRGLTSHPYFQEPVCP